MRDNMLFQRFTFVFISLFLVIFAIDSVLSETDSYLVGIYQNSGDNLSNKSKWSKNILSSDSCGGIFREKQVLIKSPNYPNHYAKNADCEYIFYSPFVCVNEFHIQFLDFQLEPSLSCSKDKVLIGTDEVLCGQVIGIMKYKAVNGTLRIRFKTDQTIENKGFELLVTRLPCSLDESKLDDWRPAATVTQTFESQTAVAPAPVSVVVTPKQNNVLSIDSQVSNSVSNPNIESVSETTIMRPVCPNNQEQFNGIWPNAIPQSPVSSGVPAFPTLPSCCINVYNQQKFYLISPGFPSTPYFRSDCLFYIERFRPNFCRLRIEFKYFLLGDWQQRQCGQSFMEIDGRRFCGCKTGVVHYTQWGPSPKSIRFTNLAQYPGIQGFVLEITQEPCPYRSVALPIQQYARSNSLPTQNYLTHVNDPRRCSYNYISWLNFNTNPELLAKSICIRNFG